VSRRAPDEGLRLHTQQQEALRLAKRRRSYVVTTGSGSGTWLDAILQAKESDRPSRTRAIVVSATTALAES
jgi:ATP-dependent helicase YprA (DUF1998 family)